MRATAALLQSRTPLRYAATPASVLRLPRRVYEEICAHGQAAYPEECCGALLGSMTQQGWQVKAAVRAANACADFRQSRYAIAPAELVRIVLNARAEGLEIAGFYHSHPDCPAQGSRTDLAAAHWLGCSYLIVEVARGQAAASNSFRLAGATEEEKHFEQEEIRVENETA